MQEVHKLLQLLIEIARFNFLAESVRLYYSLDSFYQ